jgi:hypothetical protein
MKLVRRVSPYHAIHKRISLPTAAGRACFLLTGTYVIKNKVALPAPLSIEYTQLKRMSRVNFHLDQEKDQTTTPHST